MLIPCLFGHGDIALPNIAPCDLLPSAFMAWPAVAAVVSSHHQLSVFLVHLPIHELMRWGIHHRRDTVCVMIKPALMPLPPPTTPATLVSFASLVTTNLPIFLDQYSPPTRFNFFRCHNVEPSAKSARKRK